MNPVPLRLSWLIDSVVAARNEFGLDGGQFRARFVLDALHSVGTAIPITGVAQFAFDFVQHGVNPRSYGVVLELLNELMRGIPFVGQRQFNRAEQILFRCAHFDCFTAKRVQRPNIFCAVNGKIGLVFCRRRAKVDSNKFSIMKITEILMAEHAVFHNLFDHIEAVLPRTRTLAEVKSLAGVVDKVHAPHSKLEDDLFMEPLEHCFDQIGQNETFHDEHEVIDAELAKVQRARDLKTAKAILLGAVTAARKHFDKEERIVFPMAERVLKPKTLLALGAEWLKKREARLV